MFYCHPFGRSDIASIRSSDTDRKREYNYIFFLDQEPINLEWQRPTFEYLRDLQNLYLNRLPVLVTSERDSEFVDKACDEFGYRSAYYFFHGWAALDWYRGYDQSFLMPGMHQRRIAHTFLCPNRIISGERWHRLIMFYHLMRRGLHHNHVSFPKICPDSNLEIADLIQPFEDRYPDIFKVFATRTPLPLSFHGESDHPMRSFQLDLFKEASESLLYLVTETVADGRRQHLTEKSFKPICLQMPFIILGPQHSLKYLRDYGFKTFHDFWSEDYDQEPDPYRRIEIIADTLYELDRMSRDAKQNLYQSMQPIIAHNFEHFYHGGFARVLKNELDDLFKIL